MPVADRRVVANSKSTPPRFRHPGVVWDAWQSRDLFHSLIARPRFSRRRGSGTPRPHQPPQVNPSELDAVLARTPDSLQRRVNGRYAGCLRLRANNSVAPSSARNARPAGRRMDRMGAGCHSKTRRLRPTDIVLAKSAIKTENWDDAWLPAADSASGMTWLADAAIAASEPIAMAPVSGAWIPLDLARFASTPNGRNSASFRTTGMTTRLRLS